MNDIISKKIVIIFLIIYGFFNFFNRGILQAIRGRKSDLSSYYTASIVLKNNQNPYDTGLMLETGIKHNSHTTIAGLPRVHKYVYPPILALLIRPLTYLSFDNAKIVWTVFVNPIILLLIVLCSKKWLVSNLLTAYLFFLITTFNSLYETIAFGQINILLLLFILLSIYFYFKKNIILTALFLTAGIFTKILPVILLLFFVSFKEYKYIVWSIIFSSLFLIFQIFTNGFHVTYHYFFNTLPSFSRGAGPGIANHSFYSFLQFAISNTMIINLIFYLVIIYFLIRIIKIKDRIGFLIINIALLHLIPKTVWEHHYLILFTIPFLLMQTKFYFSDKLFFTFIIFWAVFSVDYNFYSQILNQTLLIYFRYIKVYVFLIFSLVYLQNYKSNLQYCK